MRPRPRLCQRALRAGPDAVRVAHGGAIRTAIAVAIGVPDDETVYAALGVSVSLAECADGNAYDDGTVGLSFAPPVFVPVIVADPHTDSPVAGAHKQAVDRADRVAVAGANFVANKQALEAAIAVSEPSTDELPKHAAIERANDLAQCADEDAFEQCTFWLSFDGLPDGISFANAESLPDAEADKGAEHEAHAGTDGTNR